MDIEAELDAIAAAVPAGAWGEVPPSEATLVSLWSEVRWLRSQVETAQANEREVCAALVEMLPFAEFHKALPPPYPRSYLMAAAQAIRARGGAELDQALDDAMVEDADARNEAGYAA